MKTLNRYLLKEIIASFLIALGLIILVLILNDIFYLTDIFISKRVPLAVVLKVLFLLLPSILALAIPLAFMAGLLGGLSHLNADREIEALKLLGVSPRQVLKPVLGLAMIFSAVTLSFTLWLTPQANYRWLETMVQSVLTRVNWQVEPGQFFESFPGNVIYVHKKDSQGRWQGVFLYRKEEQNNIQLMAAESGGIRPGPDLKTAWLTLTDGYSYKFDLGHPETAGYNKFKKQEQLLDLKNLFPPVSLEKQYREKNWKELLADWNKLRDDRSKNKKELLALKVELNKRWSLPAACLAFAFLGLGLGWRRWPGGRAGGYGVSLVIVILYYGLLVFGQTQAAAGHLSPSIGLWLPDFLALAAGLLAYFSARREAQPGSGFGARLMSFFKKAIHPGDRTAGRSSAEKISPPVSRLTFHDRYILGRLARLYLWIFLTLVLIMAVFNFLTRWEIAKESDQPVYLLFTYIWYKLPEFITQGLQLAALIAPVLGLNFLYRRHEIQTLMTSGLSYWRITAPVLVFSLFLVPLGFFLQDRLVVRGNFEAEKIWSQLTDRPVRVFTYQNRYWLRNDSLPGFFHYELSSPGENAVRRLLIFQTDREPVRVKKIIFSQLAKIGENSLHLESGWERELTNENLSFSKFDFLNLDLPEAQRQFIKEWKEPALMTWSELNQYSQDLEQSGSPATSFKTEAKSRVAFSFSAFVLALLGTALAGLSQKKLFIFPLGLALGGGYLFWQTVAAFRSLGEARIVSAWLAAWSPEIIFILIGFYLLFRVKT
jgi:LPS export ABC transporter permease LptF